MKLHRYQYLYLPVSRFLDRASPQSQRMLLIVKISLVLMLIGIDLAVAFN